MTEKLLTGTESIKTNKQKEDLLYIVMCFEGNLSIKTTNIGIYIILSCVLKETCLFVNSPFVIIYSYVRSGPEVIKLFPCLTQLSTNFVLLINVKMPTSERFEARIFFICRYFSFYEQLKFPARLS